MRIKPISRVASVPPSLLNQRLNAVRDGLRKYGAVVLKDNDMDKEIISRLQKQFGSENVKIEKSNTIKVEVKNFGK